MDLIVNNSIFSEKSDSNDFLDTSLEYFNKNAAVMVRRKDAVRLLSMLQWFIKCSVIEKTNYLVRLANELNADDLMEVIKPLNLFVGKSFMFREATNGTICIDDKVLIDDNINLDPETLRDVQENDFKWFYNLERVDQVEVILGMTKILGVGGCRKLYQRLVSIYRSKPVVEAHIIGTETATNTDRNCNLEDSMGAQADYAVAGDVHTNVVNLQNNWANLIAKYRYEVFGNLPDKREQRRRGTVQQQPKKSGRDGKQTGKKQQQAGDNQQLDKLQLLPLFISWKILSYLDTKMLTTVQQVNSYWSFAAGQVLVERTARVSLNKMVSKMAERLPASPAPPHQQFSTIETSALRRCDRRLQQLFERGTGIASLRRSVPSGDFNYSTLLQDVFEQAHFPYGSFVSPTDGLHAFPRCPPAYSMDSEVQTPEALLIGAECAVQWLEGSPGDIVHKRRIVERQVPAVPLGRKVEAASTHQSTESLHNFHWDTIAAPQLNMDIHRMIDTNIHRISSARLAAIEAGTENQQSWHSTMAVIQEGPEIDEDVLSDLASTTRMKVVPSNLGKTTTGDRNRMLDTSRADVETVLKSFEQRINTYMSRSQSISQFDANDNI